MSNDMSWFGLYKRGIKLQWRLHSNAPWWEINDDDEIKTIVNNKLQIRYKHSIQ